MYAFENRTYSHTCIRKHITHVTYTLTRKQLYKYEYAYVHTHKITHTHTHTCIHKGMHAYVCKH